MRNIYVLGQGVSYIRSSTVIWYDKIIQNNAMCICCGHNYGTVSASRYRATKIGNLTVVMRQLYMTDLSQQWDFLFWLDVIFILKEVTPHVLFLLDVVLCSRSRSMPQRWTSAKIKGVSCCWLIWFNSLAPGKFKLNFRYVIFKRILVIGGWDISCEIALIWMSQDITDDQSTLVQVMAWCRQATSQYLSQCWLRSWSP